MICDPRLTDKPYGRRIWQSLPPMRRTREIDDVEAFFAKELGSETTSVQKLASETSCARR
jgi:ATP-dependent DNA helicase DinG